MRKSFHAKNVMEKLVPDIFLKDKNSAYFWINSPKLYAVYSYCISKSSAIEIYWNYGALAVTSYKTIQFLIFNPWLVESRRIELPFIEILFLSNNLVWWETELDTSLKQ